MLKVQTATRYENVAEDVCLKGAFPFRLGTTSYIVPDDILPNLRHLRRRLDDVELVLFESDEYSNMPTLDEVEEMARIGRKSGLSYTAHLPLDTHLGSADEEERVASVGKCRRVMERMGPVEPFAWILHLHGDRRGDPPTNDLARWSRNHRRSLADLLTNCTAPSRICVETLGYDFERVAPLVQEFGLSVCLDIGHLLVNGRNVEAHLDRWFERTRVVHVHGVDPDGSDHSDLSHLPDGLLEDLAARLAGLPHDETRVVTIEVFGKDDFERSMQTVAERLVKWRK